MFVASMTALLHYTLYYQALYWFWAQQADSIAAGMFNVLHHISLANITLRLYIIVSLIAWPARHLQLAGSHAWFSVSYLLKLIVILMLQHYMMQCQEILCISVQLSPKIFSMLSSCMLKYPLRYVSRCMLHRISHEPMVTKPCLICEIHCLWLTNFLSEPKYF